MEVEAEEDVGFFGLFGGRPAGPPARPGPPDYHHGHGPPHDHGFGHGSPHDHGPPHDHGHGPPHHHGFGHGSPPPRCCRGLTAECMACNQGISESEYCAKNQHVTGCEAYRTTSYTAYPNMCNAYVNKGGCHQVDSQQECQNLCDRNEKCEMYEMPALDNPRYKRRRKKTCCLEYCNIDTCGALDWNPPCGRDGTWNTWGKSTNPPAPILIVDPTPVVVDPPVVVRSAPTNRAEAEVAGEGQLVGGFNKLLFFVFVSLFAVLGFYIGRRKSRKENNYKILEDGVKESGPETEMTYQTL